MIREVQRTTGGFVRYNADKTVDYVADPSDGVVSGTISPQNQNVQDQFQVEEDERDDFTHLRVLGAQEGDAQIQAEVVRNSYSGGRQVWRTYTDKNLSKNSRASDIANQIMSEAEANPRRLKVTTTVFGADVSVGDRFTVSSDRDNIDTTLRVIRSKQSLVGSTDVVETTLSNRLLIEQSDGEKRRRDVETFNQGFQGEVVTLSAGGYRAPVESGNPYVLTVRTPSDVVRELAAELQVNALPYRSYVAASGHTHSIDVGSVTSDSQTPGDFTRFQQEKLSNTTTISSDEDILLSFEVEDN
jgi:hypothetical protein